MERLSFVIPVYNSQDTIEEVVNRLEKAVFELKRKYNYEIILVNDYSIDNSFNVCRKICGIKPFVKLISLSRNFGQHNAIMAGFSKVTGDYVICLDDDLQTPPEEIYKLLEELEKGGYDLVFAKYIAKSHSFFRNFGSWLNDIMANILINKPENISLGSFFIARRFLINEIQRYDGAFPYIGGLLLRVTSNIGNVIVKHEERRKGRSNYTLKKLLGLWLNGFTSFSIKPLRLSSFAGFFLALVSFLWIIVLTVKKSFIPQTQLGWTSIMVCIIFFGGIQLISTGLLGEYIGRAFLSINKAPQYAIRDTCNINSDKEAKHVNRKD
ncbi:MAG: glycosyl transferase family 2 [Clostridiales bacterium]|nr:glycosyl transferase family 2 [Clostridiales bacterium]